MAKYLDSNGVSHLIGKIKAAFLTDVSWDSTNKKLTETKNGTTSDVWTPATVASSGSYSDLSNKPSIPAATATTPKMDGTAAVGSETAWAKGDHVHPTDTSRAASDHTHGNITNGGDITATAPTIASGDKLIINDESASKITNGPAFGTSTSTYLRNDGTWATPSTGSDTKNTAGSTNDTAKLFLVGAKTQAANPQTYSNSNVYATNGAMHASSYNGLTLSVTNGDGLLIEAGTGASLQCENEYTLGDACEKGIGSVASGNSGLVTGGAVYTAINNAISGAATFQGTLVQTDSGSSATKWTQAEIEAASYKKGWYWVCEAAGTYAGNVMEAGDMLFCVSDKSSAYAAADFAAIQNNIETLTTSEIDALWTAA